MKNDEDVKNNIDHENEIVEKEEIKKEEKNKVGKNEKETKEVKPKLTRKMKILISITSVVVAVGLILSILLPITLREPIKFYCSDKFLSLNSEQKLIEILEREGKKNTNPDCFTLQLDRDLSSGKSDEIEIYKITYWCYAESLELYYSKIIDNYEIAIYLELQDDTFHDLGIIITMEGVPTIYGESTVYAPTFNRDVNLIFDEFSEEDEELKAFVKTEAIKQTTTLIHVVNDMLADYNFSLKEFGFYRFK